MKMMETKTEFSELVRNSRDKAICGVVGLGLAVELPELPEFRDDDAVAVFWLTDRPVDSKSSLC